MDRERVGAYTQLVENLRQNKKINPEREVLYSTELLPCGSVVEYVILFLPAINAVEKSDLPSLRRKCVDH